MAPLASPKPKPRALLLLLIVSQLLMLGSLLIWLPMAGLAVMAFDSGYSTQAAIFVGAVWSYPLVMLICALLAWWAYRKARNLLAAILTVLPLLPFAIFFVAMAA